jgi:hypothetical protein
MRCEPGVQMLFVKPEFPKRSKWQVRHPILAKHLMVSDFGAGS